MDFFGRGKVLRLAISDICLRRSLLRPIRSGLDSNTGYAGRARSQAGCSVLLQEFLDEALDFAIIAFPKVVVRILPLASTRY